ncbi:MAG: cytidine deaminase [Clostridiales bacterium]|nr:cytidine deaminase [Clostridiales bacterium]
MTFYPITDDDRALIATALETLAKNFDDGVYHHTVGCAVRCKNGRVYSGVNCDCIHGSCAEFVTLGMAISAGEREFDTIVAVHEKAPNCLYAPCGNCRQMLVEYCPDIRVILNNDDDEIIKVGVRELLPFAWKSAEI